VGCPLELTMEDMVSAEDRLSLSLFLLQVGVFVVGA
jgi:hypothetical protein